MSTYVIRRMAPEPRVDTVWTVRALNLPELEAAPVALLVVDRGRHVVLANSHAAAAFDRASEDLVGRPIDVLIPDWPAEAPAPRETVSRQVAGRRGDGSEFAAEIGLSTCQIGEERFVIAAVHDTVERLRLEEQLRQAQRMEMVGRQIGDIAHEFNNLLTAMNGYSDLVLAELPRNHPVRRDVLEIRSAGERAASLARHLLAELDDARSGETTVTAVDEAVAPQ